MDRKRRTRINSTLSISFWEIEPRTVEVPHLPKGVTHYCWLPEVFWGSALRPQSHSSHGPPTTTLFPPTTTNISEASPMASLHARIWFGYWTYSRKRKPVGRRSIKEAQILPRSHWGPRLHRSEHRCYRRRQQSFKHFYQYQQPFYLSHTTRNHNGFPRLHQLQAHRLRQ